MALASFPQLTPEFTLRHRCNFKMTQMLIFVLYPKTGHEPLDSPSGTTAWAQAPSSGKTTRHLRWIQPRDAASAPPRRSSRPPQQPLLAAACAPVRQQPLLHGKAPLSIPGTFLGADLPTPVCPGQAEDSLFAEAAVTASGWG